MASESSPPSRADDEGGSEDVELLGYADALAELEAILDTLEDDSVDVDVLGRQVRRAAVLVRVCRGRIDAARLEVASIVAELEADTPTDADDRDEADGG